MAIFPHLAHTYSKLSHSKARRFCEERIHYLKQRAWKYVWKILVVSEDISDHLTEILNISFMFVYVLRVIL
jgi:hypothetical protein